MKVLFCCRRARWQHDRWGVIRDILWQAARVFLCVYRQRCHKKCPGHSRHRHLTAAFSNHGLVSGCQRICAGQSYIRVVIRLSGSSSSSVVNISLSSCDSSFKDYWRYFAFTPAVFFIPSPLTLCPAALVRSLISPGASMPPTTMALSPHSHFPSLSVTRHPPQTIFGHFIRNFVQFYACFQWTLEAGMGIMTQKKWKKYKWSW